MLSLPAGSAEFARRVSRLEFRGSEKVKRSGRSPTL